MEGQHTTVVIGRHVAIRIYELKVHGDAFSITTNKRSVFHELSIQVVVSFVHVYVPV